jgi:hypothetical protein
MQDRHPAGEQDVERLPLLAQIKHHLASQKKSRNTLCLY